MQVRTIIIVEGLANLVTMMAKLWVGLSTNSAAIVGDAMHSLTATR
jgi:divalent metal cation (Fe/Co/Zn/Cd) transporter